MVIPQKYTFYLNKAKFYDLSLKKNNINNNNTKNNNNNNNNKTAYPTTNTNTTKNIINLMLSSLKWCN